MIVPEFASVLLWYFRSMSIEPGPAESEMQVTAPTRYEKQRSTELRRRKPASITCVRLTPAIGAELHGLDVSKPLDDMTKQAIYDALIEHQVVVIRASNVGPQQLLELASALGPLGVRHPVYNTVEGFADVVELDWSGSKMPDAAEWHTDLSFRKVGLFSTILQAKILPPCGGDTLFASMYAAYEDLPTGLQADLLNLEAVHDLGSFRNAFAEEGGQDRIDLAMGELGCSVQSVVANHPVTGRPYLNVNESFTSYVLGMSAPKSRQLLDFLFAVIRRPDHQVRFRWEVDMVAFWDNRATQHYAVNDYLPDRRVMHRVTVDSDPRSVGA